MKIEEKNLDSIYGGATSISSSIINALTNIIKILLDAGKGVGESIRRIQEKEMCSL
ncbi:MAG: hypothetical protein HFJ38_06060 [Bacilli bacterium]|nr:hypothetical protein [Bacilli bacterium]